MKTSIIKYSMVLAGMLLSTYSMGQASFTHDYAGQCPPVIVTFTNTSTGVAPTDWFVWWIAEPDGNDVFFDTTFSVSTTASYNITQGGWHSVWLNVYDSLGNNMGAWQEGFDIAGPQLGMSTDSACQGDEIYFNLQTQGGGNFNDDQIFWDFGDGITANGWNVNHAYGVLGTFTATLIVDAGCGIDTLTKSIFIGNAVAPVANINIWPNPVCPNDYVNFNAWGAAGSFFWTFGDGSDTTVTDPNVRHAYNTVGTKPVTMTVTNGCSLSDNTTATVTVDNTLPFTETVDFNVQPDSACPGDVVSFDCWQCDEYALFSWNFGDGSPLETNDTRPTHSYAGTGTYPIILTVTNGCGNAGTFTNTVVIDNNVVPDPAQIEWGVVPSFACPTDAILFYDCSGVSGFWDFGDGDTASSVYGTIDNCSGVFHAYADTGTYTGTYTSTNGCGNSVTLPFTVFIYDTVSVAVPPGEGGGAFFWEGGDSDVPPPTPTCEEIWFLSLVSGSTFSWNWGDGNTTVANTQFTTHAWNTPGTYTISLFVQNSCGDTATFTDSITISGICASLSVSASGSDPTCKSIADGSATATVSGGTQPYTYLWDDPMSQTGAVAMGLTAGTYTVTVTDASGNTATAGVTITEQITLSISITEIKSTCGGNDGVAIASATGGTSPYIYQWSNGVIGEVDTALSAGFYIVTVTDTINGCSEFALATVTDDDGPIITVVSTSPADCNGSGGAIDIFISQGTPPYTYLWSNGGITEDISNLSAGPYEVIVTDANGCLGLKSVTVSGQDAFSLTTTTTDANCLSATGSATVNVSGGTGPYTFSWSSGGVAATESNLASGVYDVTVTDANGCVGSATATVGDIGGPIVTVDSVIDATCGVGGSIYISVTGGIPTYTYSWSDSSTAQDLVGVQPGTYSVTVAGADNCQGGVTVVIEIIPPTRPLICLVTVDSASGKNLCVFEKDSADFAGVEYVNFYKESTQSGVFYWIGSKSADSLSQWLDQFSDSKQRAWKYKLATVDSCGNESMWSAPHKTMHLTSNLGLNDVINLLWDHYEGFTFPTYYIYRYTTSTGWALLDSIPSYLTSYTDTAPPSGQIFYQVVANPPDVCVATKKAEDYNSSRSNTTSVTTPTGINNQYSIINNQFKVYPNPNRGVFVLMIDDLRFTNGELTMYDMLGQLIYKSDIRTSISEIDISNHPAGIYHLQVITDKGIGNEKIIIE